MKEVLILGNGISRLDHKDFTDSWKGEVWAFNYAFKDISLPPLSRITGHDFVIKEAIEYRKENNLSFDIYTNNEKFPDSDVKRIELDPSLIKDSGTTFVNLALQEGYDKIYLCGFDMGGPDVYSPAHEKRQVSSWVRRWRKMSRIPGFFDRVVFIGFDHTVWMKNPNFSANHFSQLYLKGKPHLTNIIDFHNNVVMTPYRKEERILIVGNGGSRGKPENVEKIWSYKGKIWGCNYVYKEIRGGSLPYMERIFSVHDFCIIDFFKEYKDDPKPEIYTTSRMYKRLPVNIQKDRCKICNVDMGWNSGNLAIINAIYDGYPVDLIGFDFGGIDIYDPKKRIINGTNFKRIFNEIVQKVGENWINFL